MALELNGTTGVSLVQDGVVTSAKIADGAVAAADLADNAVTSAKLFSGFANGITMADMWRQTTIVTGDLSPIRGNFEQVDTDGFANLGSSMSVDTNGYWTFPSTGLYHISASARFQHEGSDYSGIRIFTTTDGSTYLTAGRADSGTTSGIAYTHSRIDVIYNVANTTINKLYFAYITASQSQRLLGASNQNETYFMFIRLGDAQ
jgi:hypothetical protein